MQSVRTRNTDLERALATQLQSLGLRWSSHNRALPGRPDFSFVSAKVAVFVDGDFWHGYRFPQWQQNLSPFWKKKIETNRRRDRAAHQKLRRNGWTVIRIWGHELRRDPVTPAIKVRAVLSQRIGGRTRR
jgi:DNA mismatch endonuclease (patch repair protein)